MNFHLVIEALTHITSILQREREMLNFREVECRSQSPTAY